MARVCKLCDADISHKNRNAQYCSEAHRKTAEIQRYKERNPHVTRVAKDRRNRLKNRLAHHLCALFERTPEALRPALARKVLDKASTSDLWGRTVYHPVLDKGYLWYAEEA